jgi:hypothetical protein
MTVRVDRLVTDVSLSREPPAEETTPTRSGATGGEDPRWDQDQRGRQNRQRLQRLELRTRAEGFDD